MIIIIICSYLIHEYWQIIFQKEFQTKRERVTFCNIVLRWKFSKYLSFQIFSSNVNIFIFFKTQIQNGWCLDFLVQICVFHENRNVNTDKKM